MVINKKVLQKYFYFLFKEKVSHFVPEVKRGFHFLGVIAMVIQKKMSQEPGTFWNN